MQWSLNPFLYFLKWTKTFKMEILNNPKGYSLWKIWAKIIIKVILKLRAEKSKELRSRARTTYPNVGYLITYILKEVKYIN